MIPDNRWKDMAFDRKAEDLMGIFTDKEGQQHKLAYSQLSDGYRNIIGLAADIAYRCIQLNPHLGENAVIDTPGIVLIDELDLHLHPNWQRQVVADLKNAFPNIQFVATTHSPFIVQSLEADELINLDKTVDTTPNDLSINEISVIFMGLESEFSEKSELLEQESISILQNLHEQQPVAQHIEHISNPAVRAFLELSKMANGQ